MTPRIVETKPATLEEWRIHHQASAFSTFFEGPEWALLWQRYTRGRIEPAPLLLSFNDGVRVVAPWSREKRRIGRALRLATPAGCYGGWLYSAEARLQPAHFTALFRHMAGRPGVWRQNPFDPVLARTEPPGGWSRHGFTQVLDLTEFAGVEDTLRRNQVYRKQRQGERAGLCLRLAAEPGDIARYFAIYEAARERWGAEATSNLGPTLFQSFDLHSAAVDFWLIERSGEVIGGGPFLQAGSRHVVSWLMLAHPDHFSVRPYEFAYAHLIHHYRDRGFRYFDFNPSGGHEGVIRFKDNFGAQRLPSNELARPPFLAELARATRSVARRWTGGEG